MSLDRNGRLGCPRSASTDGKGGRGIDSPVGDPLFSQASIQVSRASNLLVNANAGSDTISLFAIDSSDPTRLTLIGKPAPSGGDFPVSTAFNAAGDKVCALNSGTRNGVMCYNVDKRIGLIPIKHSFRSLNINQTTPPTGAQNTVGQVAFSPDGTKLFATVKGDESLGRSGFLAIWDIINQNPLTLSEQHDTIFTEVGLRPFGLTFIHGKNAILSADTISGFEIWDLDRKVSRTTRLPGALGDCWTTYSRKTGSYYLIGADRSTITEITIDANLNGTVANQYPKEPGSLLADADVASIGTKDFLYNLSGARLTISVSDLRGPANAVQVQLYDLVNAAKQAGITIDEHFVQGLVTYLI
ncbi:hypothetical protein AX17_002355 [Amanita inopinata Kibby_2008]|nr:hypothetical protein AX17_002355 [Amanita inopinata Kibby_2008]